MVLLGLLLVILAVAVGVALVIGTQPLTSEVEFEVGVLSFVFTPLQLLIAGAAVMLLLALGLSLIRGALSRRRRARQQARDAQRQAELEESVRADERRRAEEVHRNELTEREQAWEAERAERDRRREEDSESRRAELEQRIRLDERSKVEREVGGRHASSNTGLAEETGAGGVGAVGGAAAVAGGHEHGNHGTHDHADHADHHEQGDHATHHEGRDAERAGHGSTAAGVAAAGSGSTQPLEPHDGDRDDAAVGDDRRDDGVADDSGQTERQPVVEPAEPGERTVADRIMGRHPERRD